MRRVSALLLALLACSCAHRGAPVAAPLGSTERGLASWYGEPFHGRRTASGEFYDMFGATAAHRDLPFGTRLRVTRRDTGAAVEVRVNDRGPFVRHRIIDLSYAAARRIGLDLDGVAPVTLAVLGADVSSPPPLMVDGPQSVESCFWVQVGAFGDERNADRSQARLRDAGERAVVSQGPRGLLRVRVGPAGSREEAEGTAARLRPGWPEAIVVACGT